MRGMRLILPIRSAEVRQEGMTGLSIAFPNRTGWLKGFSRPYDLF